jgi:hypothetical protein
MNQEINKTNDPANAIDSKDKVNSNDRKMKQDFPGYPHNPASEEEFKDEKNFRTDLVTKVIQQLPDRNL